ncbi:DNA cytosine methyltransferase [Streptomyces sp. BK340]|uniref:DNA cytosine methyltransferase n=1 Tax=Streptomyces sp. BK340 TaxID=2572903 RepID=UPI0011A1F0D8|nr:DNA cytosine methyltransferase [Streptomyces sp. BK340]TVZ96482.1 DNA (cytosine-5)-methyltransferase 1 [Streptomyces sp. BK340]
MIVDLFSGPRGWSEGMRMLDLTDVGLELDADAARTSQAAGHTTIQCDVTQYPTAPFIALIEGLIGSPVCTPFSAAGKQEGIVDLPLVYQAVHDLAHGRDTRTRLKTACKDTKSILAAEPMRWLHDLRPNWVCMEQVPAVLPLWQQYAGILRGWGYSVWTGVLNAADYGLPQTRRRAILIASRVRRVTAPDPTHGENTATDLFGMTRLPWTTMADALGLEPGLRVNTRGARKTQGGNDFPCDAPSWTLTEKARSWWVLRQGKRANATVRRLDQPAGTLVAGHARHDYQWVKVDGQGDLERRPLLIPEAAVLQGFPPDHPFHGSESKQFLQIANAVPPLLAAHVVSAATGIPLPERQPEQTAA